MGAWPRILELAICNLQNKQIVRKKNGIHKYSFFKGHRKRMLLSPPPSPSFKQFWVKQKVFCFSEKKTKQRLFLQAVIAKISLEKKVASTKAIIHLLLLKASFKCRVLPGLTAASPLSVLFPLNTEEK